MPVALVTSLCSAVPTPSWEEGPGSCVFGHCFTCNAPAVSPPAWSSEAQEKVSGQRWGAQLWAVQMSSCGLRSLLLCWLGSGGPMSHV